jgi:hypothetical protein
MSQSATSTVSDIEDRWIANHKNPQVTRALWAIFIRHVNATALNTPDGQGLNNSMSHWFLGVQKWAENAQSATEDADIRKPQPHLPTLPIYPIFEVVPGATQQGRTVAYQEHSLLERQADRLTTAWHITQGLEQGYKLLFTSVVLFGTEIADYAMGPPNLFAAAKIFEIYARLLERLGRLDDRAFEEVSSIYTMPNSMTISGFYHKETEAGDTLVENNMGLTDPQKFMAFQKIFLTRPEVMRVFRLFEDANPDEAQRTWARLKTYMMAQDLNITRGMTRQDLYPRAQAATYAGQAEPDHEEDNQGMGESPAQAMAATNTPRMFTAQEIEAITVNAVKAAMTQYVKSAREAPAQFTDAATNLVYCWLHGWCTHVGRCTGIEKGKICTLRFNDTRNQVRTHGRTTGNKHDPTRVFGHQRCTHQPRCISVEDARKATGPESFPDTPGNARQQR